MTFNDVGSHLTDDDYNASDVIRSKIATQSEYGDSGTQDAALLLRSGYSWGYNFY